MATAFFGGHATSRPQLREANVTDGLSRTFLVGEDLPEKNN